MAGENYIPEGCFFLARQILDSAIWRDDPHVLKLFIYLLGKARHKEEPKKYPGFEIKRGELVTSLSQIADDNEFYNRTIKKWSRAKVSRMLQLLKEQEYIKILADTYGTHISICNYERFQNLDNYKADSNETQVKRKRNASETQVSINNNDIKDKKGKKEKNIPMPEGFCISERVSRWAKEKGHTKLEEHFEYFTMSAKSKNYKYADWDSAFMRAVRDNWAKIEPERKKGLVY